MGAVSKRPVDRYPTVTIITLYSCDRHIMDMYIYHRMHTCNTHRFSLFYSHHQVSNSPSPQGKCELQCDALTSLCSTGYEPGSTLSTLPKVEPLHGHLVPSLTCSAFIAAT